MTGFTYFCTDRYGNTYNRYSAMHDAPRYRSAEIYRDRGTTAPVTKAHVSYSKGEVGSRPKFLRSQDARFEDEVVAVRAYPGRHRDELEASRAYPGLHLASDLGAVCG
jgi:hypothetical protein